MGIVTQCIVAPSMLSDRLFLLNVLDLYFTAFCLKEYALGL